MDVSFIVRIDEKRIQQWRKYDGHHNYVISNTRVLRCLVDVLMGYLNTQQQFDVRRLNYREFVLVESKSRRFLVADVWERNMQHTLPVFQVVVVCSVLNDPQDI